MTIGSEDELLRAVALRNAAAVLRARQIAEEALERRTGELARSLAMTQAMLDATTDGILVTNYAGRITACNARFMSMWDVPQALVDAGEHRLLLEHFCARFDDPQAYAQRMEQIYAEAPATTFDLLALGDGRLIERQSRPQVIDGDVVGRVWSFRDITMQRATERALREEGEALELLNKTGSNLAAQLDLQAVLQSVTDAGTRITGAAFGAFFYNVVDESGAAYQLYTLSGAPRSAFEAFGHPRATPVFAPTFAGRPVIRVDDILADPRYGQWAPHHGMPRGHLPVRSYMAAPVISRSGTVIGGLFFGHPNTGVFSERSERLVKGLSGQAAIAVDNARLYEAAQRDAAQREQLLESERAARMLAEQMSALKDDFLSTLSHELRTPLTAIMGWLHILRRGARSPQDAERAIDVIERSARAQVRLIDDLLDMNRIASGKVRLDAGPVDSLGFMESAIQAVLPSAEAKSIRVERDLDPSTGPLLGDANRLQQVVANLLSNSVKFTPEGGQVSVQLRRVGEFAEIVVRDTGIGIKPQLIGMVFDRFRQGDFSTTRQYGGLGLGLSIVRSLVELHGGSVHAASDGEGRGACFTVCLPFVGTRGTRSVSRDGLARRRRRSGAAAGRTRAALAGGGR